MLEFDELHQRAMSFPEDLTKRYLKPCSSGILFYTCLPFEPDSSLLNDAMLIQQIAEAIPLYSKVTIEIKKRVLVGVMAYTWFKYERSSQWFLNRPLLSLLQKNLEIDSLPSLDRAIYKNSLEELANFCNWVYENKESRELGPLYEVLPPEMQGNIHLQLYNEPEEGSSWISLSGLMTKIGMGNVL